MPKFDDILYQIDRLRREASEHHKYTKTALSVMRAQLLCTETQADRRLADTYEHLDNLSKEVRLLNCAAEPSVQSDVIVEPVVVTCSNCGRHYSHEPIGFEHGGFTWSSCGIPCQNIIKEKHRLAMIEKWDN